MVRNLMKLLPFVSMFKNKRRGRGTMWASLLGLGVSAAILGLTRGRRRDLTTPFQNAIENFAPKMGTMNNAALTEFSDELLASALNSKEKK
ncbi:hypothetical protein [Bacillus sp. MRMR6]|uniref:hypothetical protein n=1 Tax=Bacillus sp. MRMR6 TaxID=1928617 RepID=UPI000951B8B2|nr:hypothetical protein [Bacillus sp. MRMR6]OLS39919.1 hypothetical protein BTR25_11935 [Bacillus sp. MRMR6]